MKTRIERMFDSANGAGATQVTTLDDADVSTIGALLTGAPVPEDPAARIDWLEALERLKSAAAAAQARTARAVVAGGEPGRSVGAQVGLARHESPARGRRLTLLAVALCDDLPHTMAALERGDINEHRAQLVADGTRDLGLEDRLAVDAALADRLPSLGDRELRTAVAREVFRTDPDGSEHRRRAARSRRRVQGRWLGDGTGLISAVVSDVHYGAIMNSLTSAAAADRAAGDPRTTAQLVADHFVARLAGQTTAQRVPVALQMVVSAETLLGDDDEPADLAGFGPVPASVARRMAAASPEQATRIRRLFRLDDTDQLVAMESRSRLFDGSLADFVRLRDQICRGRWCNARIRALDHIRPAADGGPTTAENGQGLCEDCNLTKEMPGWHHEVRSGPFEPHTVEVTTPTGHTHRTRAPDLPRPARPRRHRDEWTEVRPGLWVPAA